MTSRSRSIPATHHLHVRDPSDVPGELVTAPFTMSLSSPILTCIEHRRRAEARPAWSRVAGSGSGIDRDDHDPAFRVPVNVYRVEGASPGQDLTGDIDYDGGIDYTVAQPGSEYARAFSESPGLIEDQRRLSCWLDLLGAAGRGCPDHLHADGPICRPAGNR